MTQITATLSHPSAATIGPPAPLPRQPPVAPNRAGLPPTGRDGPLRSGNPRGNPKLAPRCGAKARTTGCPCSAPAMPNGRCRIHGGSRPPGPCGRCSPLGGRAPSERRWSSAC
jgi:hypothetical protein